MTQATQTGASNMDTDLSEDGAAEALLRQWSPDEGKDASKHRKSSETTDDEDDKTGTSNEDTDDNASAEKPDGENEGTDEEAEDEDASDDDTADDGKQNQKKFADEEGTYVKIKVGEKEHDVPVSQLKRLYGQEASLTQKSMAVAEQTKQYETKLAENATASAALLERAQKRFEPFKQIDFNLLAASVAKNEMTSEEYQNLRAAAQAAWEDVQFLEAQTGNFMRKLSDDRTTATKAEAQETLKTLSGPADKGGIEGWTEKVYDEVRAHAVSLGAPAEMVNNITQAWAIRLMHAAMLHARGQAKSKGDVKITKVNKTPKKIVKTTTSPAAAKSSGKTATATKAFDRLRSSGTQDDAAEALLARWGAASDD